MEAYLSLIMWELNAAALADHWRTDRRRHWLFYYVRFLIFAIKTYKFQSQIRRQGIFLNVYDAFHPRKRKRKKPSEHPLPWNVLLPPTKSFQKHAALPALKPAEIVDSTWGASMPLWERFTLRNAPVFLCHSDVFRNISVAYIFMISYQCYLCVIQAPVTIPFVFIFLLFKLTSIHSTTLLVRVVFAVNYLNATYLKCYWILNYNF